MSRVGLPLVHEEEAEGIVSAVFADIRTRMPFVPALFKTLAGDPAALVGTWLQARAIHDGPRCSQAAAAIRASAKVTISYRPSLRVREAVAPFARELPFMQLTVTSLQLTLAGELERRSAPELDLPPPQPVPEPEFSDRAEHPLFREICDTYQTTRLPSLFRTLAAGQVLEEVWSAVGPFLASAEGAHAAGRVSKEADTWARAMPEVASFGLEHIRPTLDQFSKALPRNLIIAVAAEGGLL